MPGVLQHAAVGNYVVRNEHGTAMGQAGGDAGKLVCRVVAAALTTLLNAN